MTDFQYLLKKTEYLHHFGNLFRLVTNKNLILVLGAGVSMDAGVIGWDTLLNNIFEQSRSDHLSESIYHDLRDNCTDNLVLGQLLYNEFKRKMLKDLLDPYRDDDLIESKWKDIIKKCLYQDRPSIEEKIKSDNFILKSFAPLIKKIKITINYNFDDVVETLLRSEEGVENPSRMNFEILFGNVPQSRPTGGIFHVNGFIPYDDRDISSEKIVLTENQFDKYQQEAHMTNRIKYYYQNNVCLFLGTSFRDPVLKENLIASKKANPGHFHYAIIRKNSFQSEELFQNYLFTDLNVIPLVLSKEEIMDLGRLLSLSPEEGESYVDWSGSKRVFYLVGPAGGGKTTMREAFDTVYGISEWLNLIHPKMLDEPQKLTESESREVDHFVLTQTKKKAAEIRKMKYGIILVDRSPIDAAAFATRYETDYERVKRFREEYEKDTTTLDEVVPGCLIFLTADPKELLIRIARKRFVDTNDPKAKLIEIEKKGPINEKIYQNISTEGVFKIDSTKKTKASVANEIAEIIFRRDYNPINVIDYLRKLEKNLKTN